MEESTRGNECGLVGGVNVPVWRLPNSKLDLSRLRNGVVKDGRGDNGGDVYLTRSQQQRSRSCDSRGSDF